MLHRRFAIEFHLAFELVWVCGFFAASFFIIDKRNRRALQDVNPRRDRNSSRRELMRNMDEILNFAITTRSGAECKLGKFHMRQRETSDKLGT